VAELKQKMSHRGDRSGRTGGSYWRCQGGWKEFEGATDRHARGAGWSGIGVADGLRAAIKGEGLSEEEARHQPVTALENLCQG